jgi:hypothetical protein
MFLNPFGELIDFLLSACSSRLSEVWNLLAKPKSPTFRYYPSMKMLAGLRSLWIKLF